MRASLPAALVLIKEHEGGYVNHPRDPGGCTNLGITLVTYRAHGHPQATCADLRGLAWEDAAAIYQRTYWADCNADGFPPGLDVAVFDMAVNAGPGRAVRLLQRVVGVAQDGQAGPLTVAATWKEPTPAALIKRYGAARLDFYRGLKTWPTFGSGWAARVRGTERAALELAQSAAVTPIVEPPPKPGVFQETPLVDEAAAEDAPELNKVLLLSYRGLPLAELHLAEGVDCDEYVSAPA